MGVRRDLCGVHPCELNRGIAGNASVVHKLPHLIVWLIPAAILGGILDSELGSRRLNPIALRRLLALALVVASIKMIWPQ